MLLQIDWSTLAFQIINFLILMAILAKFLFQPVMRIIDERRREVTSRLDEAAARKAEGEQLKSEYQERLAEVDEIADRIREEARREAERERDQIVNEGEEYIERRREQIETHLARRKQKMLEETRGEVADTALDLSQRILFQATDETVHGGFVDKFVDRLRGMSDQELSRIKAAARTGAVVLSAFPLSQEQQDSIGEAINAEKLTVEEDRSLLAGAVLQAGEVRVDGSLAGQLEAIRSRLEDHVEVRQA